MRNQHEPFDSCVVHPAEPSRGPTTGCKPNFLAAATPDIGVRVCPIFRFSCLGGAKTASGFLAAAKRRERGYWGPIFAQ